jgi:hypothetical protein
MKRRRRRIARWSFGVILLFAMRAGTVILLGATDKGDEVLPVEATAYISGGTTLDDPAGDRSPPYSCVAVTSPSRGPVTQLREGHLRVYDPIYGPEGTYSWDRTSIKVESFSNLGGGFCLVGLLSDSSWQSHQHVLQAEVVCPWGYGITVYELRVRSFL